MMTLTSSPPQERLWWFPLRPNRREVEHLELLRARMDAAPETFDQRAAVEASELMTRYARGVLDHVLGFDSLSHHCHLVNGWGNARYQGQHLVERVGRWAVPDGGGGWVLPQTHVEGDKHPWQALAYALMAGTGGDIPLAETGLTLRGLTRRSRDLGTDEGEELGHLLFALSVVEPDGLTSPFRFDGRDGVGLEELIDRAVRAHIGGHFSVCRKTHLTEGICAIAGRTGDPELRAVAQRFLDGQMELLALLGVVLEDGERHISERRTPDDDGLARGLQIRMRLSTAFENHVYMGGHLIELAMFAELCGFDVGPTARSAAVFVANRLNRWMPEVLPRVDFTAVYLHFGHYRRGMTMLAARDAHLRAGTELGWADLAGYTVDFDAVEPPEDEAPPDLGAAAFFAVADHKPPAREPFVALIDRAAATLPAPLGVRGTYAHFRRVGPAHWPRTVHYELLDHGDRFSAEVHLEAASVGHLAPRLRARVGQRVGAQPSPTLRWDPDWYHGCGRLIMAFSPDEDLDDVLDGLLGLIAATYDDLDAGLS